MVVIIYSVHIYTLHLNAWQNNHNIAHPISGSSEHGVLPTSAKEDDDNVLANLRNFSFVINNDVCATHPVSIIMVVPSHPLNVAHRTVLRSVYNRIIDGQRISVVFLCGTIKNNTLQEAILKENSVQKDIVQGNFNDGYRSVTYNHLQGLKWAINHCKQATYIIKVDDDIYLNLPLLISNLFSPRHDFTNKIFCSLWYHAIPKRNIRDKYYVSYQEYAGKEYPTYCNGWVVVYQQDVARQIVRTSAQISYFWMSDVFIAGMCPEKAGIGFVDMNPRYTYEIRDLKTWYENGKSLPSFLAGPTGNSATFLQMVHDKSDRVTLDYVSEIHESISMRSSPDG